MKTAKPRDGTIMDIEARMAADPAKDDLLILVDGLDRQIGTATKMGAHVDGALHRAFSVVLARNGEDGPELLLARRSQYKYHSAGLWANSCCSHPRAGEETPDAAYRRVREELGCTAVDLREITAFVYHAPFSNGLCEHEYDHVIVGSFAGEIDPDPKEADLVRWVTFEELAAELTEHPDRFAVWAPIVLTMAMSEIARTL